MNDDSIKPVATLEGDSIQTKYSTTYAKKEYKMHYFFSVDIFSAGSTYNNWGKF